MTYIFKKKKSEKSRELSKRLWKSGVLYKNNRLHTYLLDIMRTALALENILRCLVLLILDVVILFSVQWWIPTKRQPPPPPLFVLTGLMIPMWQIQQRMRSVHIWIWWVALNCRLRGCIFAVICSHLCPWGCARRQQQQSPQSVRRCLPAEVRRPEVSSCVFCPTSYFHGVWSNEHEGISSTMFAFCFPPWVRINRVRHLPVREIDSPRSLLYLLAQIPVDSFSVAAAAASVMFWEIL